MDYERAKVMWNKYRLYLCLIFVLFVLSPALYNAVPLHYFSPDLQYVKGKLLYVMEGNLYDDPITGFPNMHPPIYHLFLALPTMIGIPIDTTLLLITFSNVLLIFFFVFKIIQKLFCTDTAVTSCFLFPFTMEYMGCGYLFLATALNFSIPFYLAGAYLYLTGRKTSTLTIVLSALWGLAFLITPIYIFLIGFTLLYELTIRRNLKFFFTASATLVIMLLPFFYQIYIVSSFKLFGTSAFSPWHGLPDLEFLRILGRTIITPTAHKLTEPLIWTTPIVALLGLIGVWQSRKSRDYAAPVRFVVIALVSYLFTYYHFAPQYATRIYLFLSLFLIAFAVTYMKQLGVKRMIRIGLIALLVIFGTIGFMNRIIYNYGYQRDSLDSFDSRRAEFSSAIEKLIPKRSFILAYSRSYRMYILPYHSVHGMKAYESGEYYQLSSEISKEFQADYEAALMCTDSGCLNPICEKYGIEYAVVHAGDFRIPVFPYIDQDWDRIYRDPYFAIFKRR